MSIDIQDKIVQAHVSAARTTLEVVVGAGRRFSPMFVVVRGQDVVAHISPPGGDGKMLFQIGQLAAEGYEADEIILLTDVYTASEPLNPYTFRPWQRGEMEELAERHNGVQRGWVHDALLMLFVPRTGEPLMITMPYSVTHASGAVCWLDDEATEKNGKVAMGPLTRIFEPSGLFEPGEERPGDLVFGRFLTELGATVLVE